MGLLPCWAVMDAHRGLTQHPLFSRDARAPSVSPPVMAGERVVSPPHLLLVPPITSAFGSWGFFHPLPRWTELGVLVADGQG